MVAFFCNHIFVLRIKKTFSKNQKNHIKQSKLVKLKARLSGFWGKIIDFGFFCSHFSFRSGYKIYKDNLIPLDFAFDLFYYFI